MRQAVRVGRQILLPRIRSQGKLEFKVWQRYPAQTSGRLAAKDFVPSVSNASLHWDGSTYYSTLFHELVHSTGHESRLNRSFGAHFGDELYSKEELVAGQGLTLSLVQET